MTIVEGHLEYSWEFSTVTEYHLLLFENLNGTEYPNNTLAPHSTHDIPHCTEHPHGTEHTLYGVGKGVRESNFHTLGECDGQLFWDPISGLVPDFLE